MENKSLRNINFTITCGIFLVNRENKILIGHITNWGPEFWSIPKGAPDENELWSAAARRELLEETNISVPPDSRMHPLKSMEYKARKRILVSFALLEVENPDIKFDSFDIKCTSMVPDPKGEFPEIDAFKWVTLDEAVGLIHESQGRAIVELKTLLKK